MDDLREQLKELRLMQNQAAYRYCMNWLLVALRHTKAPLVCAWLLYLGLRPESDLPFMRELVPLIAAAIKALMK